MKCDELKAYGMNDPAIGDEYEMYKVSDVDAAIAELKAMVTTDNSAVMARLEAENSELKEAQRWRKFPEEKPEEWDTVIVRIGDSFYDLAVYLSNGQGWDIGDGTYHKPEEVTHWMPLPKEPDDK